MSNTKIPVVQNHKHLGIFISDDCTWDSHIKSSTDKAWKRLNMMRNLKTRLDRKTLQIIYFSFIRPLIEYADVVWDNCPRLLKDQLDKMQMEAARIVTGCSKFVSLLDLTREAGWESLSERRRKHKLLLYFEMVNGLCPSTLSALVPQSIGRTSSYSLRGSQNHRIPTCRTELYKRSFLPTVIEEWNKLAVEIRDQNSIFCFKNYLNRNKPTPKRLYFIGERKLQVIYTRIRNKCSSLITISFGKVLLIHLFVLVVRLRQVSIFFLIALIMLILEIYYLIHYQILVTLILMLCCLGKMT